MKGLVINTLKGIGIYTLLLNLKRSWDKRNSRKDDALNHAKRVTFYRSFLTRDDLVFDVGANVGNRVEAFLEIGCRVIAVEPQKDCVATLTQKFGGRIIVEPIGLAGEEGEMEMFIADESTISTFSKEFIDKTKDNKFKRNNWDKRAMVQISTLDKLIKKHGTPKFIKIDVEGFESEVLKGLSQPIAFISFEYNVPEMLSNSEKCIDLLSALPSRYVYNYCEMESMQFSTTAWSDEGSFRQLIKTKEFEHSDFGDVYARAES